MPPILGIDFGTAFSAAASLDGLGIPRLIPNADGETTTPCVVFIKKHFGDLFETEVGQQAMNQWITGQEHVVRSIKTQLGNAEYRFQGLSAVQISAEILKSLKRNAEEFLDESVTSAVVTYPPDYGISELEKTKDAFALAGFGVLGCISDSGAAVIAHFAADPPQADRLLMTFDIGYDDFRCTILQGGPDVLLISSFLRGPGLGCRLLSENIAVAFVGRVLQAGSIFSGCRSSELIVRLAEELERQGIRTRVTPDQLPNEVEFRKLCQLAEGVLVRLSSVTECDVVIPYCQRDDSHRCQEGYRIVFSQCDLNNVIQRSVDEMIAVCRKTILASKGCSDLVHDCFPRSQGQFQEIDDIILVGGGAHIPFVRRRLEEERGSEIRGINPSFAIAHGAALFGGLLCTA